MVLVVLSTTDHSRRAIFIFCVPNSNTSSNTTSGIVSDKVQSVDESEDDLDLDGVGVVSAAAAAAAAAASSAGAKTTSTTPSMESLALVHLRDSCDSLPTHGADADASGVVGVVEKTVEKSREGGGGGGSLLPRRLAGLARLARVGRSSNKNSSSNNNNNNSAASASKTAPRPAAVKTSWPEAASTWLRLGTVDVTDGVAGLQLAEAPSASASVASRPQQPLPPTVAAAAASASAEPGVAGVAGGEEENQYWYSCDDDASETCSTNGDPTCPAGADCSDCRLVRCSSPTHQHHHHYHHQQQHHRRLTFLSFTLPSLFQVRLSVFQVIFHHHHLETQHFVQTWFT